MVFWMGESRYSRTVRLPRLISAAASAPQRNYDRAASVLPTIVILQAAVAFALEKQAEINWAERTAESAAELVARVVAM